MIARFFQWAVKASVYMGIGAAAAIYGPTYANKEGVVEIREKAEAFIGERTDREAAEIEVLPPAIGVIKATNEELVETIAATGSIKAKEIALVGADVNGLKVLSVAVDEGDIVQKGQVLASLDRSNLELELAQVAAQEAQIDANLAQAESQVVDASVAVKQALETLERTRKLVQRKVVTNAQLESAENAYASAVARENSAKQGINVVGSQRAVLAAQRNQIQLQIEKTQIIAPVGGVVLSKAISVGAVVSGSAGPLFQIAEDSEFELAAEVPESILSSVKPGMKAMVSFGGSALQEAVVSTIDPTIDVRSRLGTVNILLPSSAVARPGSFASAEIETLRREAVSVPSGSLLYNGEQPYLQVVQDGVIESRMVKTGIRSSGLVEILEGLDVDEAIVATAGTFVANGDRVRPIASPNQTAAVK